MFSSKESRDTRNASFWLKAIGRWRNTSDTKNASQPHFQKESISLLRIYFFNISTRISILVNNVSIGDKIVLTLVLVRTYYGSKYTDSIGEGLRHR